MDFTKIAIIHLNQIGDLLFSLPLLKALRDNYPNAIIHSILKPNLKGLLSDSPYVDDSILRGGTLADTWSLLKTVRKHRYDLLLSLSRSEECLALTALSRAGVKAGFAHFPWDFSLAVKETVEGHNSWYNNRKLLNRLNIKVTKNDYVGLLQFHTDDPGLALPQHFVVISPGASRRRLMKAWGHENFADLIILLMQHYHLTPVLIGGKDNQEYNEKIIAAVRRKDRNTTRLILNLTEASLPSLSLIIKNADLFVGIDSGFMHIASSMDVPLVGLFGPTDPVYVGPQNKNSIVVREESLECIPCYLKPCEHRACMSKLPVSTVFQACEQLLTKSSC
jgi:ADP-heptose:LPS heptosyltransferase